MKSKNWKNKLIEAVWYINQVNTYMILENFKQ